MMEGARFAMGSDARDIGRLETIFTAWQVAAQLGLPADRNLNGGLAAAGPLPWSAAAYLRASSDCAHSFKSRSANSTFAKPVSL